MGFRSQRITLVAGTAINIVNNGPANGNDGTFANVSGANGDELPVLITNTDTAITVLVGGPEVTTAIGTPIAPGNSLAITCMGTDAQTLKAVGVTGAPVISVMLGRQ